MNTPLLIVCVVLAPLLGLVVTCLMTGLRGALIYTVLAVLVLLVFAWIGKKVRNK